MPKTTEGLGRDAEDEEDEQEQEGQRGGGFIKVSIPVPARPLVRQAGTPQALGWGESGRGGGGGLSARGKKGAEAKDGT